MTNAERDGHSALGLQEPAAPLLRSSAPKAKLKTDTLVGFVICHVLAVLALCPWFFSWTGVALLFVGIYVFGILGMATHFHAERIDGILQQLQRLLDRLGTILADQLQRLLQHGGHGYRVADSAAGSNGLAAARIINADFSPVNDKIMVELGGLVRQPD